MKYSLRIRPAAERDLMRLYSWYENQSVGLGRRLLGEFEHIYMVLEETPLIYADIYQGTRRAMLQQVIDVLRTS